MAHAGDRVGGVRGEATAVVTDTELPGLTDHEAQNRASWNADSDDYQARHGEQLASSTGLAWGTYQRPEAELGVLGEVAGKDMLELGCGAAQWSIALAKLGARPVGIDLSERQLEHARRLMAEAGVDFPLVLGSAEHVPLPDASFDIVFCDHGAMTFADPYRTVPEAARLLRPGGLSRSTMGRPSKPSRGRSTPTTWATD
jgi:SAM-dependent methyltransferase